MNKQLKQVEEFHKKFSIPILEYPKIPSVERCALRNNLIQEEVK
jgi:predicted HAD superfamily Cof-like phosphohydrolase